MPAWASEILPIRVRARPGIGSRLPSAKDLWVFAGYVACGGVYVLVGVHFTDFLLSFWVALVYLVVCAWAVPLAVRRWVRR
jgi:hypothetical protein